MPNYLTMSEQQQILALLALGWSYRRIEAETGVRRETISRYDQRRANAATPFPRLDRASAVQRDGLSRSNYREARRGSDGAADLAGPGRGFAIGAF